MRPTRSFIPPRGVREKANVGVIEHPDVGNAVPRERDTRRTHAEGPARITLGIDARVLEHLWMHHSRPKDLEPARAFAHRAAGSVTDTALDVHLRRRLREREEAGAEA